MKRILLVLAAVVCYVGSLQAAPGDTTTIQAHYDLKMTKHGAFDTLVAFPDGSKKYRKIIMEYTLGRYACPGSPQYCGDWDYTISTSVRTKNGDTMEIGRLISPYAGDGWPRTGPTWKHRYVFDVTDFYNQLKDTAYIRNHFGGYSWGFTANIKFYFIEGTPPRDVVKAENLWRGSKAFGKTPSIDDRIDSKNRTAPSGTQSTELALTITGHGSDAAQCSEFCKKYYEVTLNSNNFDKTDLWRDNCGYNHMYPQNGTWIYNRGNWCPGDTIQPRKHKLAGVTGGSSYDIDVDFEDYTSTSGNASYIFEGNVFYYGGFNKNLDASLDDIIAPTDHERHFRENPFTGKPMVTVTNTGATTITSIKFEFGIDGGATPITHTWKGSLASLQMADVELEILPELQTLSNGSTHKFNVRILEVNGTADDDATNNALSSTFKTALKIQKDFRIELKTNGGTRGTTGGVSETEWKLYNLYTGKLVAERINNTPNTFYNDTIRLWDGMYKLVVTDAGCDGTNWWVYPNYPVNPGPGTIAVKRLGSSLPYTLDGYFNGDFGCGFTQYINIGTMLSVSEVSTQPISMSAYPNPATDNITVSFEGVDKVGGTIQLVDMTGRVVLRKKVTTQNTSISTTDFANGMYTVVYTDSKSGNAKLQTRVLIAK